MGHHHHQTTTHSPTTFRGSDSEWEYMGQIPALSRAVNHVQVEQCNVQDIKILNSGLLLSSVVSELLSTTSAS